MTTPADLTLCVIYGRVSLSSSAGSCCYCVSCTLTFSPNLLAALPHFITQQYGLSLIITYWFFIIINAVRVVYKASFEWAAEAELHRTNAPCLWFEQGQRNQSPLIGDLQRETRIVHRRSRQSTQSGDFPLTCVHAARNDTLYYTARTGFIQSTLKVTSPGTWDLEVNWCNAKNYEERHVYWAGQAVN